MQARLEYKNLQKSDESLYFIQITRNKNINKNNASVPQRKCPLFGLQLFGKQDY